MAETPARVALVTGGTRGIGAAVSRALASAGHRVVATYAANIANAQAFSAATAIPAFRWDVSDPEACVRGAADVAAAVGPVDILVNNAGITGDGWFHKMEYATWSAVLRTNLDSMYAMTRPIIGGMRERGFGRIVNISSINAQKGQIGQVNYAASKAGVLGFTRALALECATKGITVNAVCPGYVDTELMSTIPTAVLEGIIAQIPAGRLGRAEEVAALVAYLASDAAAYTTGATFAVNGGLFIG